MLFVTVLSMMTLLRFKIVNLNRYTGLNIMHKT